MDFFAAVCLATTLYNKHCHPSLTGRGTAHTADDSFSLRKDLTLHLCWESCFWSGRHFVPARNWRQLLSLSEGTLTTGTDFRASAHYWQSQKRFQEGQGVHRGVVTENLVQISVWEEAKLKNTLSISQILETEKQTLNLQNMTLLVLKD